MVHGLYMRIMLINLLSNCYCMASYTPHRAIIFTRVRVIDIPLKKDKEDLCQQKKEKK
jgi:hypothetical protein